MPDRNRPRFLLLAVPETSPLVLFGLAEVLGSVGTVYPELTVGAPGAPELDVALVAASAAPFRSAGNVLVEPDLGVDEADAADVVIVCDTAQPIDSPPRGRYGREIDWLRRIHARGAIVASVCSGSLLLAESGLLDGLEAAGHWCYRDMFRDHYPRVRMREDLVLCTSGEERRVLTAGAVSAWQDLALYLIARFCGPAQAIHTAKVFLFAAHGDGQLPYSVTTPRLQTADAVIRDCQLWIADNYACANPVSRMAARAGLRPRSFARRFRAATGHQPMDYVHAIRVEEAKQLLETGSIGVEDVAHAVGYEDPASFGRLFKRRAGLTPAAYRRRFAGLVACA